ncbi:MAG TPA: ABC transporter ATP-binding protein [Opitutaceae bacterium]|nr:ABC transporter ATP-binding protein [Opitutaceae bacterium]
MSERIAEARDVWKSYDGGRVTVLRGVSFAVEAGEIVALWGPSGSGKSTLLHLLGGLDAPDRGEVTICGLSPRAERERLQLRRRRVGFVFQLHNLIADLTLAENLQIPSIATGAPRAETTARMRELTDQVGLSHRLGHRIQDLSGGERQRTALCRALMHRPQLVLADEPTGALDEETGAVVFELLRELARAEGVAVVLATHERRFAEACDRLVRVRDGTLVES